MNGLVHEIIANEWYEEEYVAAHTMGFDDLKQTVMEYPPEKVAEICEVEGEQIREAARIFGESERLLRTVLQGFYQSHQATAASCQVNDITSFAAWSASPAAVFCTSTVRTDNHLKVRLSATLGEEPEVELGLV